MSQSSWGMNVNAGVLLRIAKLAHGRIAENLKDRESHDNMDAIVAVLFSAASLEAFINELWAMASNTSPSDPPAVKSFASFLAEIEESRGSTRLKYLAAAQVFQGTTFDKGTEPFQSLGLLFRLRDSIVHLKGEELSFDENGALTWSSHNWVQERLRSLNILSEYDPTEYVHTTPTWLSLLSTRAVAHWAINVASSVVWTILDMLPPSQLKDRAESFYRKNFAPPDTASKS